MRWMPAVALAIMLASGAGLGLAQERARPDGSREEMDSQQRQGGWRALESTTVGARRPQPTDITPPASPALTLDGELVLGGPVFYGTSPFLHRDGAANTALGDYALTSIVSSSFNTAVGSSALIANTTGSFNTAVGAALRTNTTGSSNTAIGDYALRANVGSSGNTAVGAYALNNNVGYYYAGYRSENTAVGNRAMAINATGAFNVAVGSRAMYANSSGTRNTAMGLYALSNLTTGHRNTAVGSYSGDSLTVGENNIFIGADASVNNESDTIRIGRTSGTFGHDRAFVAGVRGVTTGVDNALTVVIDSSGQMGTSSSSRRYKEEIAEMGPASGPVHAPPARDLPLQGVLQRR